jgi:hypothetical protein
VVQYLEFKVERINPDNGNLDSSIHLCLGPLSYVASPISRLDCRVEENDVVEAARDFLLMEYFERDYSLYPKKFRIRVPFTEDN